MKQYRDIEIDDKFGLLTVVAYAGKIKYSHNNNRKHWICKCECGQEKICNDSLLKNGSIKSCGCLKVSTYKRYKRNVYDFIGWCNDKGINIEKIWDYSNNICEPKMIDCKNLEQDIYLLCHIHGSYSKKLKRIFDNINCPVCMKLNSVENTLAVKYPSIQSIWSSKNNFTPHDISYGFSKKVWLKCSKNIHDDYQQYIRNAVRGNYECPKCAKKMRTSKAQDFVNEYLKELGFSVLHEYDCDIVAKNPITNRFMPYDNEIPELKVIIEVNGVQHYQEKSSWNVLNAKISNISVKESLLQQKYRDKIKREYAIKNGYCFIEIPYWRVYNDSFKNIIDNCIKTLAVKPSL